MWIVCVSGLAVLCLGGVQRALFGLFLFFDHWNPGIRIPWSCAYALIFPSCDGEMVVGKNLVLCIFLDGGMSVGKNISCFFHPLGIFLSFDGESVSCCSGEKSSNGKIVLHSLS